MLAHCGRADLWCWRETDGRPVTYAQNGAPKRPLRRHGEIVAPTRALATLLVMGGVGRLTLPHPLLHNYRTFYEESIYL